MTRKECAIVGLYTGIAMGPFSDIHEYAEKLLGRPIQTYEFASPEFREGLKNLARSAFIQLGEAAVPEHGNLPAEGFMGYIGKQSIDGKAVAVYRRNPPELVELKVVDPEGKAVPGYKSVTVTPPQYWDLSKDWHKDCYPMDAQAAQRALDYLKETP